MEKVVPTDAILIPDHAERVFQGILFDVYQWQQKQFDETEKTFEMLKRADTVVVIGVADDHILFLEERQPHTSTTLNFPGGRLDPEDTSVLAAAQREMREETGYEFNTWRLVDVTQPHTKIEWFIHTYLASDIKASHEPIKEPGEKITIRTSSFEAVKQLCRDGQGDLGIESRGLFEVAQSLADLLNVSEFSGQEVDR